MSPGRGQVDRRCDRTVAAQSGSRSAGRLVRRRCVMRRTCSRLETPLWSQLPRFTRDRTASTDYGGDVRALRLRLMYRGRQAGGPHVQCRRRAARQAIRVHGNATASPQSISPSQLTGRHACAAFGPIPPFGVRGHFKTQLRVQAETDGHRQDKPLWFPIQEQRRVPPLPDGRHGGGVQQRD